MFVGLFKPKFYTKCKSMVKHTKTRVEALQRQKNVVYKYLKKDIADLLKNNLDYNAYGRIEGLLDGKKRLSCYDFLQQFCACVGSNVSLLQKSRACPEECREAIASLMYAAAGVSEVPELHDLRSLLTERYGNSLEPFVNQEQSLQQKEMKLQLMHEIAHEFSIQWDSSSLKQKLHSVERNRGSAEDTNDIRQRWPELKKSLMNTGVGWHFMAEKGILMSWQRQGRLVKGILCQPVLRMKKKATNHSTIDSYLHLRRPRAVLAKPSKKK